MLMLFLPMPGPADLPQGHERDICVHLNRKVFKEQSRPSGWPATACGRWTQSSARCTAPRGPHLPRGESATACARGLRLPGGDPDDEVVAILGRYCLCLVEASWWLGFAAPFNQTWLHRAGSVVSIQASIQQTHV